MTSSEYKTLVLNKTRQTSATFTDAEILLFTNLYIYEIASQIQEYRPDIWNIPATFDLMVGRREYAFPTDVINSLNSLEIKLDEEKDYQVAIGLKMRPRHPLGNETEIVNRYKSKNPHYYLRRNAIYLLSDTITNVTDGGILIYNSFPAKLIELDGSDDMSIDPSTTKHGFPQEFHELLARRVSIAYKNKENVPLNEEEQNYKIDLELQLQKFSAPADDSIEEMIETPDDVDIFGNGYTL